MVAEYRSGFRKIVSTFLNEAVDSARQQKNNFAEAIGYIFNEVSFSLFEFAWKSARIFVPLFIYIFFPAYFFIGLSYGLLLFPNIFIKFIGALLFIFYAIGILFYFLLYFIGSNTSVEPQDNSSPSVSLDVTTTTPLGERTWWIFTYAKRLAFRLWAILIDRDERGRVVNRIIYYAVFVIPSYFYAFSIYFFPTKWGILNNSILNSLDNIFIFAIVNPLEYAVGLFSNFFLI